LFQKVKVTGALEDELLALGDELLALGDELLEDELLPPLEQAAAARATPRPSAAIAAARLFFIIVETPRPKLSQNPATARPKPHRISRQRAIGHAPFQGKISYRKLRNTFGPLICRL
jgi:hypothetical protein